MSKQVTFIILAVVLIGGFGCQNTGISVPCLDCQTKAPSVSCPSGPYTCVTLTWNASVGGTTPAGYHIWQGTQSGVYTVEYDAGNNLTYQVTGLTPGAYYFAATAYAGGQDSGYSNEAAATIPATTLQEIRAKGETFVQETAAVIPGPNKETLGPDPDPNSNPEN